MKISLIQPGRNNLKYLKWSYDSIRKNQGNHEVEICIADDFSNDGTWEWCQQMMNEDSNFAAIRNEGPTRLGHTILYDRLVNEVATSDICMIYHADMYLCPGALDAIQSEIKEKTIVSLTRIEPPLHPPGPEKILEDFGIEPEEFKEDELLRWLAGFMQGDEIPTTDGIFAPWAFYKKDFQEINGHDPLYAPQSKEDSDIFNRFQLNGIKFIQTWRGFVYHMTCRGSRFADGAKRNPDGNVFMKNRETDEWLTQNHKSTRNFIRKWGQMVKHDEFLKPIITPKYDLGFIIKNCNDILLKELEPWCNTIYIDDFNNLTNAYFQDEKRNTLYDLSERVQPYDNNKNNSVLVEMDGRKLSKLDYQYLVQLQEIIATDESLHDLVYELQTKNDTLLNSFELGSLKITINSLETLEKDLIVCKK